MNQMMNRISRIKKERDKLTELMLNNETGNDMLNERVKSCQPGTVKFSGGSKHRNRNL